MENDYEFNAEELEFEDFGDDEPDEFEEFDLDEIQMRTEVCRKII